MKYNNKVTDEEVNVASLRSIIEMDDKSRTDLLKKHFSELTPMDEVFKVKFDLTKYLIEDTEDNLDDVKERDFKALHDMFFNLINAELKAMESLNNNPIFMMQTALEGDKTAKTMQAKISSLVMLTEHVARLHKTNSDIDKAKGVVKQIKDTETNLVKPLVDNRF